MNRFALRGHCLRESKRVFERPMVNFCKKASSDKDKENPPNIAPLHKGTSPNKQQSIQEESYFHKEEVEQLKALKKKVGDKHEKAEENEKKDEQKTE